MPDDELERLAGEHGPNSVEAIALENLRRERAQDKQAHAYRVGEFYIIGPPPDAATEMILSLANEYIQRLKGSKP